MKKIIKERSEISAESNERNGMKANESIAMKENEANKAYQQHKKA